MDSKTMKLQGHEVELTHLDKIVWPRERYTKGDVIQYYAGVAQAILPYLKNRPVMLHRYPRGIHNPGFYQKNLAKHPPWVETVAVKHENRTVHYPLIQNKATLLYLANLGCIDFHPLLSPIDHLKRPSYLVLDLDPEDLAFEYVIETALVIRDILESAQVKSCCKTSGGRGLHIIIPTAGQLDFMEAKEIAHALALCVQKQLPRLISLERRPAKRQGKVAIDYLRNTWGQSVVSPYSIRPLPKAPVSTPLQWKEVKMGLDPLQFTLHTIPKRLKLLGDIFKPVMRRTSVKKLLELSERC